MNTLAVVPQAAVDRALAALAGQSRTVVEQVYIQAANGQLVNPDSLFLRPDPDPAHRERIIALPAYVAGGPVPAMGIKWISSFPGNLDLGLPRASALIVLNDLRTGFPVAVLEGARISAHRTAMSAAVGARALSGTTSGAVKLAVIGTGFIADTTVRTLAADGWEFATIAVHDLDPTRAEAFADRCAEHAARVEVAPGAREAVADADLVLLATTAVVPHLSESSWFKRGAVVLHMSLRDFTPEAMAGAVHVVDEVGHALRERTSLGLAVDAGLVERDDIRPVGDYLQGKAEPDRDRLAVYSPFGLGSLDIAIAGLVLEHVAPTDEITTVPDFSS
ncbi:2,3-diaminopropionate biosynthesis protein SbnB [Kitasatospora viridis]|uniref:Ornithine cyclodeaminase n=1 Tax=Kitasatospora viridis TaxID=281105 RepID=A0A561T6G5_9ACTN|nr:2,3-diaminopropionate biosynthesis protein SbnB [Kitasatospora viridis]TWF82679.1 ornithine cyclodeaminase [Kitasatospora viridis]